MALVILGLCLFQASLLRGPGTGAGHNQVCKTGCDKIGYYSDVARDLYHSALRAALEKEGWQITADPYKIRYGRVNYEVDLAAENVFAAERGPERIAIEVKSFIKESIANEFHAALGQFLNYKLILENIDPERRLYLAVRQEVFEDFFQYPFTQEAIRRYNVNILVFQPATQEVVSWKNSSDTEN
jgi:XisH protein